MWGAFHAAAARRLSTVICCLERSVVFASLQAALVAYASSQSRRFVVSVFCYTFLAAVSPMKCRDCNCIGQLQLFAGGRPK
jgi:hypothetical protein